MICTQPFSTKEFFKDSPWLNVPKHRQGEIVIAPLYPRLGLPGGSSTDNKMSKLAALAARRRQKENLKSSPATPAAQNKGDDPTSSAKASPSSPAKKQKLDSNVSGVDIRTSEDDSHTTIPLIPSTQVTGPQESTTQPSPLKVELPKPEDFRASPSSFARTMFDPFGNNSFVQPNISFTLPEDGTKVFDFSEPSPDDIITKAQASKTLGTKQVKPPGNTHMKEGINTGMKNLNLQEPEKIKSKNIDVVAEYKKVKRKNAANFVVIG